MRISDWSSDVCSSDLKVKTVLPTLLADKTISDKDKLAALNSAFDADSSLYHPANILAAESLVQDVSHESEEGVDIRMSLASMIDATNQYRTAKQKLLNQEKIGKASCRERMCQYV